MRWRWAIFDSEALDTRPSCRATHVPVGEVRMVSVRAPHMTLGEEVAIERQRGLNSAFMSHHLKILRPCVIALDPMGAFLTCPSQPSPPMSSPQRPLKAASHGKSFLDAAITSLPWPWAGDRHPFAWDPRSRQVSPRSVMARLNIADCPELNV